MPPLPVLRARLALLACVLALAPLAGPAAASMRGALDAPPSEGARDAPCDFDFPVGRCGFYPGEVVIFCWVGRMPGAFAPATDPDAIVLAADPALVARGGPTPVGLPGPAPPVYVLAPAVGARERPVVFLESNAAEGLQRAPATCGRFFWYDVEDCCTLWVGPFGVRRVLPDQPVA